MNFALFSCLRVCQTVESKIIVDLTTAVYTHLVFIKEASHVDAEIFVSVNDCLVIFFWIRLTCESHFSVVSIWSSSTRISVFEVTMLLTILIVVCMLNFFEFLDRWINWYFVDAKTTSCRNAHFSHFLCTISRVLQFFSMLLLYVKMLTSSTNLISLILILDLSHMFSKSAL